MRRFHLTKLWALPLLLLLAAAAWSSPASAELTLGIFKAYADPEQGADLYVRGFWGEYLFNSRFGLEAGLGRFDGDAAFTSCPPETFCIAKGATTLVATLVEVDQYTLDLSASWRPRGGDAVLFAGPGLAYFDYSAKYGPRPADFESHEEILTFHAGVGYEWKTGGRLSVRPEVRARQHFAEAEGVGFAYTETGQTDVQFAVSLGWRLTN